MIPAAASLSRELAVEARSTRRLLERVPESELEFRPHPKSMSLEQLASHLARIPAMFAAALQGDGLEVAPATPRPPAPPIAGTAGLLSTVDASVAAAQSLLAGLTEEQANAPFRVTHTGNELFTLSRLEIFRTMVLNHWYHHRGQLSVYLRLLDLSVPATYGRSADEDFLAAAAARAV